MSAAATLSFPSTPEGIPGGSSKASHSEADPTSRIGKNIQTLWGIGLQELAMKAGIPRDRLFRIAKGIGSTPSEDELELIAGSCECTVEELLA
jgi:hypothetical protein